MPIRSLATALGLLGLLAGCEREAAAPPAPEPAPPTIEPEPAASDLPGFVGRWAASDVLCETDAWIITTIRLDTPAGGWCAWAPADAETTPDGWVIPAVCEAEGDSATAPLQLEGPAAGPVSLSGGVFSPVTLVRCDEGGVTPGSGDPTSPSDEADAIEARIARDGIGEYDFRHFQELHRAWRVDDQIIRIEEGLTDEAGTVTGQRVFYFRAGERDPVFVREATAAYAFEAGRLTWAYGASGEVLTDLSASQRADRATALLERGRTLRRAADG